MSNHQNLVLPINLNLFDNVMVLIYSSSLFRFSFLGKMCSFHTVIVGLGNLNYLSSSPHTCTLNVDSKTCILTIVIIAIGNTIFDVVIQYCRVPARRGLQQTAQAATILYDNIKNSITYSYDYYCQDASFTIYI